MDQSRDGYHRRARTEQAD